MSKAVLPKRVKFLLCDDVRLELNGKFSLSGLYPDDKILVQPDASQLYPGGIVAMLSHITIVCIAFEGEGSFPAEAELIDPQGNSMAKIPLGTAVFNPGVPTTIVLQGGMFAIRTFGQHKCHLSIGTKILHYNFEVLLNPAAPIAVAAPKQALASPKKVKRKSSRKP